MGAVFYIPLQSINGHYGLVIIEEWVIVGRKFRTDIMYLLGIQAHKGNGEAVPHFLLKLRHHTLYRNDKDSLSLAADNKLTHKNARLQRLAKADSISNQDTLTRSA